MGLFGQNRSHKSQGLFSHLKIFFLWLFSQIIYFPLEKLFRSYLGEDSWLKLPLLAPKFSPIGTWVSPDLSLRALLLMWWTSNFTLVLVSFFCPIFVNFGVDDGGQVHPIIPLLHFDLFFVSYHYNISIYSFPVFYFILEPRRWGWQVMMEIKPWSCL